MEPIVNKVAESGIITLDPVRFLPGNIQLFDLKPFLFMELILKEKDFRASLQSYNWEQHRAQKVILTCTTDAIIPVWAYMLVASALQEVQAEVVMENEEEARKLFMLREIDRLDITPFEGQRIVLKGCGDTPIPEAVYVALTMRLKPVAKSIMYGEPCSTVPVYKKKQTLNPSTSRD
ncbi:MAG TPA: DUF2480 family protein [Chitinophagaceae bacterium]|nr:DUF2480 family protein [Chitinophagaceae bacterium]HNF71803.1 DUF2480 family protein [Chitinophagaceae bacterium]